jgi:uncharacterized protein YigE (DUF2233 family)
MKRIFALLLILLPQFALPSGETPGLSYEHRVRSGPQSIHILTVDPKRISLRAERALGEGVGRETVSSMVARTGALGAINAGFFRIGGRYDGEPDGILKINGKWFSDPALARGAMGWRDGGSECLIGRLMMRWTVTIDGKSLPVDGINRPRSSAESILYDWAFHRSTLTDPGGLEIGIARNRVTAVEERGDSPIPVDGYVYSVGPKSPARRSQFRLRSPAQVGYRLEPAESAHPELRPRWESMDFIIGGVPVLISDGRLITDWEKENARPGFAEERHPRTAVGVRADGSWVLLVVDGRQPSLSIGMTLKEVADTMASLGCVSALNLDGGGSSTMVLEGRIVNSPSDAGRERPVSDAILLIPRPLPPQPQRPRLPR